MEWTDGGVRGFALTKGLVHCERLPTARYSVLAEARLRPRHKFHLLTVSYVSSGGGATLELIEKVTYRLSGLESGSPAAIGQNPLAGRFLGVDRRRQSGRSGAVLTVVHGQMAGISRVDRQTSRVDRQAAVHE